MICTDCDLVADKPGSTYRIAVLRAVLEAEIS